MSEKSNLRLGLDDNFIRRVYRTSTWAGLCILFFLLWTVPGGAILNSVAGFTVGMGVLKSHEVFVRDLLSRPGRAARGNRLLVFFPIKLLFLFALFYALDRARLLDPIVFLGGFSIVYAVIVLKVTGMVLNEAVGARPGQPLSSLNLTGSPRRSSRDRGRREE